MLGVCPRLRPNSSNKIGKINQKLRRIIKYFMNIFAYSKHIKIIGNFLLLPSRQEIQKIN